MISLSEETLQERGEELRQKLEGAIPYLRTQLLPTEDTIGGGSFPGTTLKGLGVSLTYPGISPALFQKRLRFAAFPVISVVRENALVCHLRTLLPEQMDLLVQSVKESVSS